jgi:transposase
MGRLARIGVDTAKSVFQLHGVDEKEQVVLRKQVRRREFLAFLAKLDPIPIALEACGASHHWARELGKLGHQVMLIPPQHVKPYVGHNKNDKTDAAAICEAMSRPKVVARLVPIKSIEQSAAQTLLGIRENLIKRRTQLSNSIRSHAAEFGLVAAKGLDKIEPLLERIEGDDRLPLLVKEVFVALGQEFRDIKARSAAIDKKMLAFQRTNELARRLVEVPTVGPVAACLAVTKIVNPQGFRSGRQCAAWIGLTPKDRSSGGKQRHGGITRAGDESLRAALVCGATAYLRHARSGRTTPSPWLAGLLKRKPPKLVAVALANKTARIIWKLMTTGERYDPARAWAQSDIAADAIGIAA